jgi:hypothetical protein
MNRREFINGAVGIGLATAAQNTSRGQAKTASRMPVEMALETFEYKGVRLLPGMFSSQVQQAYETYFGLSNEDMLKGFRREASLPAPGNDMTGWARLTCLTTFGQWLSGMARMSSALGDSAMREKAIDLADGWAQTIGSDGDPRMDLYAWDKMVCGLVDLHLYAGCDFAMPLVERTMHSVSQTVDRTRTQATPWDRSGKWPKGTTGEWYTLPENLYRAYLITGNSAFRDFGDVWRDETYWSGFESSPARPDYYYLHAYSHMNTFSSAAMAYAVTGNKRYLQIIRNAYDWAMNTQCYASGGYGPGEWTTPPDGTLGTSIEVRSDDAEIPCGSWAGFKLSRYLLTFTGEARYGDWIETLLYNGIGAALPVQPDGRTFYYADYRLGVGNKLYFWEQWPCCSGTYIQTVADYHNVIYFKNQTGLFVNLYVPSEVTWDHSGQKVTVRQETSFPETDSTTLRFIVEKPVQLKLSLRVPGWATGIRFQVNGQAAEVAAKPGEWATLDRTWNSGDSVVAQIPMELRLAPIDRQHPRRAAVMFGPVLLAQEARFTMPLGLRDNDEISKKLVRDGNTLQFHAVDSTPRNPNSWGHGLPGQIGEFWPFYSVPERLPYRVYFDLDKPEFI